jgi:GNAT superfamily N-acetyltransferase
MSSVSESLSARSGQPFIIAPFMPFGNLQPIIKAWEESFRDPPNGPRYGSDLIHQIQRHAHYPNFHSLAAYEIETNTVLGMAYGHSNEPGQWWFDSVARVLGEQQTQQCLINTFILTELGVIPRAQRHGVARALVENLFSLQPHSRAVLSTRADNEAGISFYMATGWHILIPKMSFGWGFPPYSILTCNIIKT